MSHPPLHSAAFGRAAIGLVAVLALAGCGAGQITQTSTQLAGVDGVAGTVGQIGVRDAAIVFDPSDTAAIHRVGGEAPLQLSIVNFGSTADTLVSASSPVAASVTISGNPTVSGGRSLIVDGGGAGAPTATAAAAATPTGAPASTSVIRSGAAAAASVVPPTTAAIPTADAQGDTTASIVLTGLTQDIRAGLTYPVVFTFQRAGAVTVQMPVADPTTPRTDSPGPA